MKKDMTKVALDCAVRYIKKKRDLEKEKKERDLVKKVSEKASVYIENIRKIEEKSNSKKLISEEKKASTLIVAGKCKKGVVMVADKRTMRGTEYREEKKIYEFFNVITAFAGLTGLKDKFLEMVKGVIASTRAMNLSEAIIGVEDTMSLISKRYKDRLKGEARITALLAGLEHLSSGKAKLYHVIGQGYAEEVDFLCIGHGSPYATCLSKGLYKNNLSMERMAEIGIFLVSWVENVDSSVGGIPDVFFVKDEEGITEMEVGKIKEVYDKAKKISNIWQDLLPKAIRDPEILETVKKK